MVSNLINDRGNATVNQFIITDSTTTTFQSYNTKICEVHHASAFIAIDANALNYSKTTSKHLYIFLRQSFGIDANKKMIEGWINSGNAPEIQLYNTAWTVKTW